MKIDKMNIFMPLGIIVAFMGGTLRLIDEPLRLGLWSGVLLLLGYFIIRIPYDMEKYKD